MTIEFSHANFHLLIEIKRKGLWIFFEAFYSFSKKKNLAILWISIFCLHFQFEKKNIHFYTEYIKYLTTINSFELIQKNRTNSLEYFLFYLIVESNKNKDRRTFIIVDFAQYWLNNGNTHGAQNHFRPQEKNNACESTGIYIRYTQMEINWRQQFLVADFYFVLILSTAIVKFTFMWSVRNKHKPSALNVLVFTLHYICEVFLFFEPKSE